NPTPGPRRAGRCRRRPTPPARPPRCPARSGPPPGRRARRRRPPPASRRSSRSRTTPAPAPRQCVAPPYSPVSARTRTASWRAEYELRLKVVEDRDAQTVKFTIRALRDDLVDDLGLGVFLYPPGQNLAQFIPVPRFGCRKDLRPEHVPETGHTSGGW